ncbi:DEAD/DEAH box helicase [Buchananella felis]|uniref:DEAD/DEAH box helicase n=1 Tax=Buchananella felis TaxID=3231492 RepID=UPI003527516E
MAAALNELLDELIDRAEAAGGDDAAQPAPSTGMLVSEEALADAFASWAASTGRPLYPHQEEAFFEVLAGSHVIAATPTGSGKSLIAASTHLYSLARDDRTYYTAPLKALVSEKFFELVNLFGAANVGMLTGDTAINADAPIICCTAEILALAALREGPQLDVGTVVMDEFHFYADPQRGWAWQVPLLCLPQAQFVLLSATLGEVDWLRQDLERRTGRPVALVEGAQRPVPLEFEYSLEPIQDLLERLVGTGRSPVYVVHFSQKEAMERAQALTSIQVTSKEQRARIAAELEGYRFNTAFGRVLSKLLRLGIGVHHAGLLPRYRRLVERLTQQGLLPVICGTDTLGVGINVPIRTVVFTGLTKFDGQSSRHLTAREFHQIAGRAGRAGFDTVGYVVVQAPEHVIENAKALAKAGDDEKKRRKIVRKKAPEGFVNWTDKTFERLRDAAPEKLSSQLQITAAMILSVLQRRGADPVRVLAELLTDNHEPRSDRNELVRQAVRIYASLRDGQIVQHVSSAQAAADGLPRLRLAADLPERFALDAPLAPFALAALDLLNPQSPDYALDVISVFEATLEDPRPVLWAQENEEKGRVVAALKADGVDYDARMEALEDVTWPRPLAALLSPAFEMYRRTHPWVGGNELAPKSVVRHMIEHAMTFADLISRYDLARSEGVVLRYLTDAYRALRRGVPPEARTPELDAMVAWLGSLVRAVDTSLLDEWVALGLDEDGDGETDRLPGGEQAPAELPFGAEADGFVRPSRVPARVRAAVRTAMFRRVEFMARDDVEGLSRYEGGTGWSFDQWDQALGAYWEEHEWIGTDAAARGGDFVEIVERVDVEALLAAGLADLGGERLEQLAGPGRWLAIQTLDDEAGERDWRLVVLVDLAETDQRAREAYDAGSLAAGGTDKAGTARPQTRLPLALEAVYFGPR